MGLFGRTFRVTTLLALAGAVVVLQFSGSDSGVSMVLKGKPYEANNIAIRQLRNASLIEAVTTNAGTNNATLPSSIESNNNDKRGANDSTVNESLVTQNATIANAGFIHLGKTGGSTLSLQLVNGCHSFVKKPCHVVENETIVSKMVTDYYHIPDMHRIPKSRHETYFVTSRDPLERLISAFCYMHPENRRARNETVRSKTLKKHHRQAYQCFPTLETFAEAVGNNNTNNLLCNMKAQRAVKGKQQKMTHLWANYKRLVAPILPFEEAQLYVFRTEHLWNDWTRVNSILAPNSTVILPTDESAHARDMGIVIQPVTRDLSAKGRNILCHAIEQEYKVYFALLDRAVNLNATDIQEARDLARKNCPENDFS